MYIKLVCIIQCNNINRIEFNLTEKKLVWQEFKKLTGSPYYITYPQMFPGFSFKERDGNLDSYFKVIHQRGPTDKSQTSKLTLFKKELFTTNV